MNKSNFSKLLSEIDEQIKMNKPFIEKALNEEYSKGTPIRFEKIQKIIKDFENVDSFIDEHQNIAVCYDGRPEITLTYILDSIVHNNNITYCINGNKRINEVLMEIVQDSLINCRLKNDWINYDSKFNEIYLRDTEKNFDKLVYVGDYFEYERFKTFFKKPVEYNNYGYIKLYIDQKKKADEYRKIMKFAYDENIYLEVYNDVRDFLLESKKYDFAILYLDDFKVINQAQKFVKADELLINSFPFEDYKFKIKR